MASQEIEGLLDILEADQTSVRGSLDDRDAEGARVPEPDTWTGDRIDCEPRRECAAPGAFSSCRAKGGGTTSHFDSKTYSDKVLAAHMRKVKQAAERGGLSGAIVNSAEHILASLGDLPHLKRVHKTGIIEGAVFVAACNCKAPRTPREVGALFDESVRTVIKGAQMVQQALAYTVTRNPPACDPSTYVPRFLANWARAHGTQSSHLDRDEEACKRWVLKLTRHMVDESPAAIAAAAVCIVVRSKGKSNSAKKNICVERAASHLGVQANSLKRCLQIAASVKSET